MTEGFPELTDSFLSGQDIFYAQFNELEFYVEDVDQEHFYFNVLRNLFPALKFEKIFSLNGKTNVKNEARINVGNKKKVYIVDLDFDHILETIEELDNLFYLKKYSIENYLISKPMVYEVIRAKNPKLKDADIDALFDFDALLNLASKCLKELTSSFIIIQKYTLGLAYYGLNCTRDFDFSLPIPCYRMNFIPHYLTDVARELKNRDNRYSLRGQMKKFKSYFKDLITAISNIPGKYILTFLKEYLQSKNLINQMNVESFTYALSKDFKSNELNYLRTKVSNYIK